MLQYEPANIRGMRFIIVSADLQQTESRFETTKTRAEIGTQECEVISTVSFLGIIITRTGALPNTLHAAVYVFLPQRGKRNSFTLTSKRLLKIYLYRWRPYSKFRHIVHPFQPLILSSRFWHKVKTIIYTTCH